MKILGIDSVTKILSIGASDGNKTCEYNIEMQRSLSSLLGVTIKRILDALGWKAGDIDYLACGLGPGSFTGIRVGVSAVKGLSWANNIPIIGISTLDIIAKNAQARQPCIISAIDAKRDLIYCSVYKNLNGSLTRIAPYKLASEKEFLSKIKKNSLVLGDAAGLYGQAIASKGAIAPDKDCWYPKGHNIVELALSKLKSAGVKNSFDIKPIYLFPKECQIRIR